MVLKGKQLWGSRFSKGLDEKVNNFNSSLPFDKTLYKYDIKGSIAHVSMLCDQNIISKNEKEKIIKALNEISDEIETGKTQFNYEYEDIHSFIEMLLVNKIGDTAKKVHTARSRNDQVALDIRLFLKDETINIQNLLLSVIETLIELSKNNIETIMPGYTHLQRAQAITFAHHLGAYIEMFKRDFDRLFDSFKRIDVLPLGAGALAGTSHNIDKTKTAKYLNFNEVALNTIDAVSDRDFIIEAISDFSIIMMHLSRLSEEIILWSSYEYKFVELDDSYSTGSSIMPQKKNPDIAELIRGKTGRVYGNLVAILTVMKSLPLAYNKDMQEDKEPLFDSINTIKTCLKIINPMLKTLKINKTNMLKAVKEGFLNATDIADYLVGKNLPFRDAHKIAGEIVLYCINNNKNPDELTLDEFKKHSYLFSLDIFEVLKPEYSINSKKAIGSPSYQSMQKVIQINKETLEKLKEKIKCQK